MKIQITGGKYDSFWYSDKIGKIFEVEDTFFHDKGMDFYILAADPSYGVRSENCKIVNETFTMLKSYQDQKSGEPA